MLWYTFWREFFDAWVKDTIFPQKHRKNHHFFHLEQKQEVGSEKEAGWDAKHVSFYLALNPELSASHHKSIVM